VILNGIEVGDCSGPNSIDAPDDIILEYPTADPTYVFMNIRYTKPIAGWFDGEILFEFPGEILKGKFQFLVVEEPDFPGGAGMDFPGFRLGPVVILLSGVVIVFPRG
jgi:hypothetical protein